MTDTSILRLRKTLGGFLEYALCFADGTKLPCQRSLVINTKYNDVTTITVEFVVDRKHIVVDKLPPETSFDVEVGRPEREGL